MVITPVPGRVVWYHEAFVPDQTEQPLAAIVCHVWSDRMVNLCVFSGNGVPRSITSVTLRQPGDVAPAGQFCEWMPYQVGHALKTEELQKLVEKGT